ncbi:hypothetical protein G4G28_09915 [Massilia sp. Dwa41.01b]|nr:hypothetical protein G4G28_09915 [Massilia sp. Dwa41.01b]
MRQLFFAACLGGAAMPASAQAAPAPAQACLPLVNPRGWSVTVFEPGNYCLGHDLKQVPRTGWLRLPHATIPHEAMIFVGPGNVTIDMAGHSAVAAIDYGKGMTHLGGTTRTDGAPRAPREVARAITLRNGSIRTTVQAAVVMAHRWNGENLRLSNRPMGASFLVGAELSDAHGDLTRYQNTDYVLEDLTLTSDQIVVLMQGKRNIIRRCRIIGGNGALNLFGPDLVFENNEIVMTARSPAQAGGEPQVALYVEDGRNARIRNNRFVIKGQPDGAVAMAFKNSAGVVLEGNTVEGKAGLYRTVDEKSTVQVRAVTQ